MLRLSIRLKWRQLLIGMVAVGALVLTGCGDEDQCAGVSCEFGVCDSANGQCANPDECRQDTDCVPGYACSDEYMCEAAQECTADDECAAGVCQGGACVNPSSCESNDDCVARTFCGPNGSCEADPCNDVTCQRGVCERGTDNCVSADSCTVATELTDCVSGDKCAEGSCESAETFCDDITCERGECSFEAGGCDNASDCQGDDTLCMDGSFCNDQNQCQTDLCAVNEVDCGGNGVCVPSAGLCQNATSCSSNAECTADHLCVDDTCRLAAVACGEAGGDGGCPGNQSCDYNEDNLTASCAEPAQCQTSFDCTGDRQCGGQNCVAAVTCEDDYYEPNDAADAATDFFTLADGGTLSGSVCSSDSDFFTFESGDIIDPSARGTLLVEVNVPTRDHGLGQIEVTLTDPSGATQDNTSGALGADGHVRIEKAIGLTDHGMYTVEISAGDDMSDSGVNYDLSVNLLPNETIKACEEALPLRVNQRVSGDTSESTSGFLGSTCTMDPNPATEVVYTLELDAPQEVTFHLTPQLSSTDVTMSLRSRCTQLSSERGCADDVGAGEPETMSALLEPGTHYLVVQSEAGSAGAYELFVETVYTACAAGDAYCEDENISKICTASGGRFNTLDCDAGCKPSTGRCFPPPGDVCLSASLIDADTSVEIDLNQLNNEYSVAAGGCIEEDPTRTDGPEQTFEVEIPANTAITAEVAFGSEAEGSLYMLDDCQDVDGTCLAGAAGSVEDFSNQEELTYTNFTDDPVTAFLVVDTVGGQVLTTADLIVSFVNVICTPDENRCDPGGADISQICNQYGTEFLEDEDCGAWACGSAGICDIPESCTNPLDVTSLAAQNGGITYADLTWGDYANDLGGSGCGLSSSDNAAHDVVFQVSLQDGEAVRATLISQDSSPDSDPSMYIMPTCGQLDSTCLAGAESNGAPLEASYVANGAETVFVVADSDDTSTGELFDVTVEIVASCDQNTHTANCQSGDVEYCAPPGLFATYGCGGGGCTSGLCDVRTSDYCYDAEDLTADASVTDGLTKSIDFSQYTNRFNEDACGGISDFENDGQEAYFRFDLAANDTLVASLDNGSNFDDPALLITDNCDAPTQSCLAGDEDSDVASVSYFSPTATTVWLIADQDDSTSSDVHTLTAEIVPGCDPQAFAPFCQGGDVEYCGSDNTQATFDCAGAGCTSGSCESTSSDWCFDAENITTAASGTGGTSKTIDWTAYSNDLEADLCGGISDYENDGQDAYFEVDLLAGQRLSASLDNGSSSDDPALILTSVCADPASACLAGNEDSTTASIEYLATQDETLYLIADNDEGSGSSDTFTLDVDIVTAACNPQTDPAFCSDSSTLDYCDSLGNLVSYSCGTSTCVSGSCDPPTGEICADRINATADANTAAGYTLTGVWSDYTANYVGGGCGLTSGDVDGDDIMYQVDLLAGQTLTAQVTNPNNPSIWYADPAVAIMSSCGELSSTNCLNGAEGGDAPATATYMASADETVYVYATHDDTGSNSQSEAFEITLNIQ